MSKTITIPNWMDPYVVYVNGVTYKYPAGETVTVPDGVAAVIQADIDTRNAATEQEDPPKIVRSVNGKAPDINGNVEIPIAAETELDESLTASGKAADAAAVGAAISAVFNNEARLLLLRILRNGIYESDQSENISALENALNAVDEYEYSLVYEIEESEITVGAGPAYTTPPFSFPNTTRSCYVGDKILIEYGYIYKFVIETRSEDKTVESFNIGVQAHNSGALELFKNGKRFCFAQTSGVDVGTYDEGWQVSGYEFLCPETIVDVQLNTNSAMNPGFAHMSFKRKDNGDMSAGDISKILVYRKKVQA